MKVKLIQPESLQRPMDTSLKARMAPHLGLLTIARIVEECGHEVVVVNENLGRDEPSTAFDLVGISATVDVIPRAKELADAYEVLSVPVAVGGIGVSAVRGLAEQWFRTICLGPAEGHWRALLSDAASGRLKPVYETSDRFEGKGLLPPSFKSVQVGGFLFSNVIAASRGCPFACDFCYNSIPGIGRYRHRTVESVIDEIRSKRTRHIMFIDDNFIGDLSFAKELMAAMKPLRLKWAAAVSANIVDLPEILDQMADCGCRSLFVGFESLNPDSLAAVHKGQNRVEKYERLVGELHSWGIMINASFVFGLDADDPETFDRTVAWIVRHKIETVTSHILTPCPGTPVYERMKTARRITDENLSHYDTAHVVYRPFGMSAEELWSGYLRVYRQVYSLRNILKRLPRSPRQIIPYLLFNFLYRKYGTVTERLGFAFGFNRIGKFARCMAYWLRD